ncbi:glycoside hydrolase superfamily [Blakeslea trispora]|nr:glycoside hydrolase superfamily [Blakeslea trispora]
MLAEGFQCWSTTRELDRYSRLAPIPRVVAWATQFNLQGDYDFFRYANQQGQLHATGYTYFRHTPSDHLLFLGSISEQSGYTYFKADLNRHTLSVYKDIEGKTMQKGQTMQLQIYIAQRPNPRGLPSIWQQFASYYDNPQLKTKRADLTGWSSWYNFYERVTEKDVVSSLTAFKTHQYPIDVFQIDDGYQTQIGDWLEIEQTKFPNGMASLANKIKQQGYLPGLWLAPFAVGFKSRIVKEHPDWLLRHPNGSPVIAGPNWGGFYAMDIYHPEVEQYLQQVFDTVIETWGFGLLKLDFLFAAAMIPRNGKTRGEILWDAMDMIVRLNRYRARLLGSGVTLPSTWGKLDYVRISSDASPWWDHSVLRLANVRERVSTFNALTSTLNRWAIRPVVGSDPDVFFIRSDKNQLTADEKHTLVVVNSVIGQLTLMSDNVDLYSPQEHRLYRSMFPKAQTEIEVVEQANEVYKAKWTSNGCHYLFFANLSPLPKTAQLPLNERGGYDIWFEQSNVLMEKKIDWLRSQASIFLRPHQTRLWMRLDDDSTFAGSTGHLMPGTEIKDISVRDDSISIELNTYTKKAKLFLRLKTPHLPKVYLNGQQVSAIEKIDWDEHLSVAKITL